MYGNETFCKNLRYDACTDSSPQRTPDLLSERGTTYRIDGPVSANDNLLHTRRRTLVDPVPKRMQVHQPGDHAEFMVELTYGLVILVYQACVALKPSDGGSPGSYGVDPVNMGHDMTNLNLLT